ncbi:DUF2285 domain-containing protein [Chelativorans intermedius]|uniref:DUF2285 domain-containing protein n=1 Tax=Chelativorans intermedius TaxID=515947 RepID=A0ABV6DBD7_9HYPH|nr:DUF2285 domain-containing protein [Chelativorans intermedius]MCT9000257.1 DUF2285 domain-containing protein [Chelativorans intermedius]
MAAALQPTGGCDFPADPHLNALNTPLFWLPAAAPAVVHLVAALPDIGLAADFPSDRIADRKTDDDGLSWAQLKDGANLVGDKFDDRPLGVLLPFDADWSVRLAAANRLYHQFIGRDADPPITPHRRARLKRALQTIDARGSGATYRAIATHFFGAHRVAEEPWKTSSLKAQVARLVAHGRMMIRHGYRQLLKGASY